MTHNQKTEEGKRIDALERAFDQMWRDVLNYPFPQICKLLIAANMLSEMEQLGFVVPRDLARAVVTCDDEEALAHGQLGAVW